MQLRSHRRTCQGSLAQSAVICMPEPWQDKGTPGLQSFGPSLDGDRSYKDPTKKALQKALEVAWRLFARMLARGRDCALAGGRGSLENGTCRFSLPDKCDERGRSDVVCWTNTCPIGGSIALVGCKSWGSRRSTRTSKDTWVLVATKRLWSTAWIIKLADAGDIWPKRQSSGTCCTVEAWYFSRASSAAQEQCERWQNKPAPGIPTCRSSGHFSKHTWRSGRRIDC